MVMLVMNTIAPTFTTERGVFGPKKGMSQKQMSFVALLKTFVNFFITVI